MTTPDRPSLTAGHSLIDAQPITSISDLAAATRWLDHTEALAGIPLVDEGERERLASATGGAHPAPWGPFLLRFDGDPVGYAAAAVPLGDVDHVAGDLAVATDHPQLAPIPDGCAVPSASGSRDPTKGALVSSRIMDSKPGAQPHVPGPPRKGQVNE